MSDENQIKHCIHVRELLDAEISVIKKHIDRHKWFRHILDDNIGMNDFIKEYGWIMREMYCCFICKDRDHCALANKIISGGDLDEYEE